MMTIFTMLFVPLLASSVKGSSLFARRPLALSSIALPLAVRDTPQYVLEGAIADDTSRVATQKISHIEGDERDLKISSDLLQLYCDSIIRQFGLGGSSCACTPLSETDTSTVASLLCSSVCLSCDDVVANECASIDATYVVEFFAELLEREPVLRNTSFDYRVSNTVEQSWTLAAEGVGGSLESCTLTFAEEDACSGCSDLPNPINPDESCLVIDCTNLEGGFAFNGCTDDPEFSSMSGTKLESFTSAFNFIDECIFSDEIDAPTTSPAPSTSPAPAGFPLAVAGEAQCSAVSGIYGSTCKCTIQDEEEEGLSEVLLTVSCPEYCETCKENDTGKYCSLNSLTAVFDIRSDGKAPPTSTRWEWTFSGSIDDSFFKQDNYDDETGLVKESCTAGFGDEVCNSCVDPAPTCGESIFLDCSNLASGGFIYDGCKAEVLSGTRFDVYLASSLSFCVPTSPAITNEASPSNPASVADEEVTTNQGPPMFTPPPLPASAPETSLPAAALESRDLNTSAAVPMTLILGWKILAAGVVAGCWLVCG